MTHIKTSILAATAALGLVGAMAGAASADSLVWGHLIGGGSVENLNQHQLNRVQNSHVQHFYNPNTGGNHAAIIQYGNGHGAGISQTGGGNTALVTQDGSYTNVIVTQTGNHNVSSVTILPTNHWFGAQRR
ncbi:MAG: hypothetical protein AAFZ04_10985 [Pseudomonadota bacterium]